MSRRSEARRLLDDLTGRDFTMNAIASRLDEPDLLYDPLGGHDDLLVNKVLRLCADRQH